MKKTSLLKSKIEEAKSLLVECQERLSEKEYLKFIQKVGDLTDKARRDKGMFLIVNWGYK